MNYNNSNLTHNAYQNFKLELLYLKLAKVYLRISAIFSSEYWFSIARNIPTVYSEKILILKYFCIRNIYGMKFYKYICTRFKFKYSVKSNKIVNIVYNKRNIAFYHKNYCIILFQLFNFYIINLHFLLL